MRYSLLAAIFAVGAWPATFPLAAETASAQLSQCKVSLADYQLLRIGMTWAEARKVISCDGSKMFEAHLANGNYLIGVSWQGSGGVDSRLEAVFEEGADAVMVELKKVNLQ